jgi:3,4-dihydroxy 2-butanone 4-phosphate synthase/GTP cyclohydrolase II
MFMADKESVTDRIRDLVKQFASGKPAVVFDSKDRENEADIIVPCQNVTPEDVNFMISKARGLLCVSLSEEIVAQKGFPLMPSSNTDPHSTAFTLSIDSASVKTGISPAERCQTARDLLDPGKTMKDFITPGHLFPLIARNGGILERQGHTEAAVTLCRWGSLSEAALICEMIKDDGEMYSEEEAKTFAREHDLPFCTIADLVEYQKLHFSNIKQISKAGLPTAYGAFDITVYNELYTGNEHIFLSLGDYRSGVLRIHSECFTGDVLGSKRCDCQSQLHRALAIIEEEGKGAVIYLRQEGRGIGLGEKIKAYELQQQGLDTVEANIELGHGADQRDYHQAAWILKDQGYETVRLLTNNPDKQNSIAEHGIKVIQENHIGEVNPVNLHYLLTKKTKMGHSIKFEGEYDE